RPPPAKAEARDDIFAAAGNVHDIGRDKSVDALSTAFKVSSSAALAGAMAPGKPIHDGRMSTLAGGVDTTNDAGRYDLDFHLDDADKPAPFKSRDVPPVGADGTPAPSQLAGPAAALELDKLDLSFDPERRTFEDPTPSRL